MSFLIRGYSESDMIALARVWNASGLCAPPLSLQQTRELFAKSAVGLVATEEGRVVGALRAVPCADGPLAKLAVIELSVEAAHRGAGRGRALLQCELALLSKQGFAGVFLPAVPGENAAALALCAGCGLQKTGTLPDFFGPGRHAVSFYYACPPPKPARGRKKSGQAKKTDQSLAKKGM